MNLGATLRLIRAHRVFLLVGTLTVVIVALGLATHTRQYSARGSTLLSAYNTHSDLGPVGPLDANAFDQFASTEMELIRTQVLPRVAASFGKESLPVVVSRRPGTQVLDIVSKAESPELAKAYASKVLQTFVNGAQRDATADVQRQIEATKLAIEGARGRPNSAQVLGTYEAQLDSLNRALSQAARTATILENPKAPTTPTTSLKLVLFGATVLGFLLSLILAAVIEQIVPRLRDAETIARTIPGTPTPVEVDVPPLSEAEESGKPSWRTRFLGQTRYAAGMARLTNQVLLSGREHDSGIVVVSSSSGSVGKTSVAVRLARSLAATGADTVFIAAERDVAAAKYIGVDVRARGLADLLALDGRVNENALGSRWAHIGEQGATPAYVFEREPDVDECLLPTRWQHLRVLPYGTKSELLIGRSEALTLVVKKIAGDARWIVVDAPPVLTSVAAVAFPTYADTLLIVVSSRTTSPAELVEAVETLELSGLPTPSVVLNQGRE